MMANGALDGIVVLDFSTLLPGPMATLFLAEAGAEVIKIERPDRGDDMRGYTPKWGVDSANFNALNRGKKSIALDLKNEAERARLRPLIERADIVIEQFRPGVMKRLGLGFDDISAINPQVVYCSISGYGQSGPKRDAAGHDLNYIGDSGLLALSLGDTETPVVPPALVADIAGGSYPAVFNILLALRERDRTGKGTYIDIAMAENVLPFLYWALAEGQATGQWPGNSDALVTGGTCRYRIYPTADNRFVAVAAIEQKFWDMFVRAIGLEEALRDDSITPHKTTQAVAEIIRSRSAQDWREVFAQADCCCTVVQTASEAVRDPHFRARGVFDRELVNEDGITMTALNTPVAEPFRKQNKGTESAPRLGEYNDVLSD